MALAHVEFDATNDATGELLTNVEARVELEGAGLISIFSDRAGATPYSNPQTFADGHIDFYAAGGAYKITLTAGAYSRVLRYKANGLLAEKDALTAAAVGALPTAGGTLTGLLTTNGQVAFPATQNPSADANTLDDYEEGTFTPVLTFVTPGDLSVVYGTQNGRYTKIGRSIAFSMEIFTTTFTHTTASGNLHITGFPFTAAGSPSVYTGLRWQGITKAGFTDVIAAIIASTSRAEARASASGAAVSAITAADMPTGGTVQLGLSSTYTE